MHDSVHQRNDFGVPQTLLEWVSIFGGVVVIHQLDRRIHSLLSAFRNCLRQFPIYVQPTKPISEAQKCGLGQKRRFWVVPPRRSTHSPLRSTSSPLLNYRIYIYRLQLSPPPKNPRLLEQRRHDSPVSFNLFRTVIVSPQVGSILLTTFIMPYPLYPLQYSPPSHSSSFSSSSSGSHSNYGAGRMFPYISCLHECPDCRCRL